MVFMGTPDFAVPSLEALIDRGYRVVGVVTQPDRPRGRKQVLTPPPVKVVAEKRGLSVFQPEKLRDPEGIRSVLAMEPDLVVTAAYGQIVPQAILDAPRYGCINVHASLLPKYRGGAPIHRAVIDGEKETGITIMKMVPELDAGDILTQRAIPIDERDHAGSLHDKLSRLGAELLIETLPALLSGRIQPIPQDDRLATYAPNLRREDEWIDWTQPARKIYDHVRGLHPWPVASTTWRGTPLKIWWVERSNDASDRPPGTVIAAGREGIEVAAGEGTVRITQLQPAGKKPMKAEEFLRGRDLSVGERLGQR
ncbi:MAG: methionyl-tRNA formyltransferase [Planifilum fulgidum]